MLAALGFRSGFTHMEWYRKADGEAVFGEIGARPPGARVVDVMNFATDGDIYVGWAKAVVHGPDAATGAHVQRRRHLQAGPRLRRGSAGVEGLDRLMAEYGEHIALVDLLPVGAPRRDWRSTVTGDGMVVVRHPELQQVIEMTERFAEDLTLYAA